ncbi:MAG: hypothetical protein ACTHKL_29715 [Streptosporangiaceae bacterium]
MRTRQVLGAGGHSMAAAWLAVAAAGLLTACATTAGAAGQHARPARSSASIAAAPSPSASPTARNVRALPVAPGQGARSQTRARPQAHGPAFRAMATDLWLAVRTGRPSLAKPAFFPLAAYKQVKAIFDAAGDWRSRLWLDFRLDVRAAHRLLGPHPAAAKLLRVIVPSAGAAWIDPGVCYNKVGYWHVAGPRVVYRERGKVRSFGIASLISWRGVWYVVHFGGITRPAVGMVDTPASGPGYPGPQGGC